MTTKFFDDPELKRCQAIIANLVSQHCNVGENQLDSMGVFANAAALRYLASVGRVEILHEAGRRVIARWKP